MISRLQYLTSTSTCSTWFKLTSSSCPSQKRYAITMIQLLCTVELKGKSLICNFDLLWFFSIFLFSCWRSYCYIQIWKKKKIYPSNCQHLWLGPWLFWITKWSTIRRELTGSGPEAALHLLGNFLRWLSWRGGFISASHSGSNFHSLGTWLITHCYFFYPIETSIKQHNLQG